MTALLLNSSPLLSYVGKALCSLTLGDECLCCAKGLGYEILQCGFFDGYKCKVLYW